MQVNARQARGRKAPHDRVLFHGPKPRSDVYEEEEGQAGGRCRQSGAAPSAREKAEWSELKAEMAEPDQPRSITLKVALCALLNQFRLLDDVELPNEPSKDEKGRSESNAWLLPISVRPVSVGPSRGRPAADRGAADRSRRASARQGGQSKRRSRGRISGAPHHRASIVATRIPRESARVRERDRRSEARLTLRGGGTPYQPKGSTEWPLSLGGRPRL